MKNKAKYIKDYIVPEHPALIKGYLATWIFTISFFGTIIAIGEPRTPFIFNTLIPIIIVMDLFAVFILCNVEKWQKLYILYVGIYCFILSMVFYIYFYKIVYLIVEIKTPVPLIFSITMYILILIVNFFMIFRALKTGYYSGKENGKGIGKGGALIVGMAGTGVGIGKMMIRSTNYQTFMLISAFVALFLSYILILGTHNIYKYYLIKKYEEYVPTYTLSKDE